MPFNWICAVIDIFVCGFGTFVTWFRMLIWIDCGENLERVGDGLCANRQQQRKCDTLKIIQVVWRISIKQIKASSVCYGLMLWVCINVANKSLQNQWHLLQFNQLMTKWAIDNGSSCMHRRRDLHTYKSSIIYRAAVQCTTKFQHKPSE